MGVLNILIHEIAERGDTTGRYVALPFGRTLTKGRKFHRFLVTPALRVCLETWLNTPEERGGRPQGPSPFLFPSSSADNGQMSTATLTRIFKSICQRAGLSDDARAHLHAMRHSCAHTLSGHGNTTQQISLVLGHESTTITEKVYLRDTVDRVCTTMNLPDAWSSNAGTGTPMVPDVPPTPEATPKPYNDDVSQASANKKSKKSTREATAEMLTMMKRMLENP